jgi:hypothetical protein
MNNIPIILILIFLFLLIIFVLLLNKNTFTDSVFDHVFESYQIPGSTGINNTISALNNIKNIILGSSGITIYNSVITRQNIFTYTNADNTEIRTNLFCNYISSPNKKYVLYLTKNSELKLYNTITKTNDITLGTPPASNNNNTYILTLESSTSQLKVQDSNFKTIWTLNSNEYYGSTIDVKNLGTTVLGVTNNGRIYIVRDNVYATNQAETIAADNKDLNIVWDMNPKTCLVSSEREYILADFERDNKPKYSYINRNTDVIKKLSNNNISISINNSTNSLDITGGSSPINYPRNNDFVVFNNIKFSALTNSHVILNRYGYLVYYNNTAGTRTEFKLYSSKLPFVGNSTADADYPFSLHIGPNYKQISKITDPASDTDINNYLFLYRHDNSNNQYPIDIMPVTYINLFDEPNSSYIENKDLSTPTLLNIKYNLTSLNKMYTGNNTFGFLRDKDGIIYLCVNDTVKYNSKFDITNYIDSTKFNVRTGDSSYKSFLELVVESYPKKLTGYDKIENPGIQIAIYQTNMDDKTRNLVYKKRILQLSSLTILPNTWIRLDVSGAVPRLMWSGPAGTTQDTQLWPQYPPVDSTGDYYYNIYLRGGILANYGPTAGNDKLETSTLQWDSYRFFVSKLSRNGFIYDDNVELMVFAGYNENLIATKDQSPDTDSRSSKWIKYSLKKGECLLIMNYRNTGFNNKNENIKDISKLCGIIIHNPTDNYYTEGNNKSDYDDILKYFSVNSYSGNNALFLESDMRRSRQYRYVDVNRVNNDLLYNFNNSNTTPYVSANNSLPGPVQDFYFGLGYTYGIGTKPEDYETSLINTLTPGDKSAKKRGITLFSYSSIDNFLKDSNRNITDPLVF